MIEPTALNPPELVILLVGLVGFILVAIYYKTLSNWLVIAYGFLLISAIMTNIENLFWYEVFNFIEHSVGNIGAGVTFAVAAYVHRQRIRSSADRATRMDGE